MEGTARFIMLWGSGQLETQIGTEEQARQADGVLSIVLERQEHLAPLVESGVIGKDSRVFSPGVFDDLAGPVVLGYDGSLSDPGADVQIGAQYFLQTQDYGTSEYLSLIGPTLVRIVDDRDLQAFVEDADRARSEGAFQDFVTHPMVRLCDVAALGASLPPVDEPLLRLHVRADGSISTSTSGLALGEVGDTREALVARWRDVNDESAIPCAVSLAGAVSEDARTPALAERPWIGRYHDAVTGVRNLRMRDIGEVVSVSGFGGRLDDQLSAVEKPADDLAVGAPVLLWTEDTTHVFHPPTARTFELSRAAGGVVEQLLVHGSVEQAAAQGGRTDALQHVDTYFREAGVPLC